MHLVSDRLLTEGIFKKEEIMGAKGRKSVKKPKQNKVKKGEKK